MLKSQNLAHLRTGFRSVGLVVCLSNCFHSVVELSSLVCTTIRFIISIKNSFQFCITKNKADIFIPMEVLRL